MKTILVPVDFSDNSKNALDYAIKLAKRLNMKLMLLHAFHPTLVEAISDSYKVLTNKDFDETPKEMKSQLNMWQKAIVTSESKLDCDVSFVEGDLADEINELIENNDIDLIVMGTKGATGLKSVFIGSNTARVIETVLCPVLAVPTDYKFRDYKKIAFATDYHDSDKISVDFLIDISKQFDSQLEIVHIANEDIKPRFEEDLLEHFTAQIKKSIAYKKMNFNLVEGGDSIKRSLSTFILKNQIDLLAISTRERILTGPLFNRGLTKNMAHHIVIPLLVFHAYDDTDLDLY